MTKRRDMTGETYNSLTATRYSHTKKGIAYWEFQCKCGESVVAAGGSVRSGYTGSCGCSRRTHGLQSSKEYIAWQNMIQRCTNPKHRQYRNYGGRGIMVCEGWRHSFMEFLSDMGKCPSRSLTLERVDNNKGYHKDNCKWDTYKNQSRNKRTFNPLGAKGIRKRATGLYQVSIGVNGRSIHLGSFERLDNAISARKEAERVYGFRSQA